VKTILILRHAKSDWGTPDLPDFDRPLAPRGLEDAPRIGQVLARFNCIPDQILASPAQRARQTAQMAAAACGYQKSIQWADDFYGGDSHTLIEALQRLSPSVERALMVGHNPTMEETVSTLLAGPTEDEAVAIRIPTAGLVCLEVGIADWAMLQPGQASLRWFLIPKLVKAITG